MGYGYVFLSTEHSHVMFGRSRPYGHPLDEPTTASFAQGSAGASPAATSNHRTRATAKNQPGNPF